jgi:hypothetical protein
MNRRTTSGLRTTSASRVRVACCRCRVSSQTSDSRTRDRTKRLTSAGTIENANSQRQSSPSAECSSR